MKNKVSKLTAHKNKQEMYTKFWLKTKRENYLEELGTDRITLNTFLENRFESYELKWLSMVSYDRPL